MRNFLIGILTGILVTLTITSITILIKQPGCAVAGEPTLPTGWYFIHEWKGNPIWCHQQ